MSILEEINDDLNWRESEIASMRILINSPNLTPNQRTALLRASWALLYAHYEGFCKNVLNLYYEYISQSGVKTDDLPGSCKIFALESRLKALRDLPYPALLDEVTSFHVNNLNVPPCFKSVDTKSNLWANVLIDLLIVADLDIEVVNFNRLKLNKLVGVRNKIAHGENSIINEVKYFIDYIDVVYDVMYDLALQVEERLSSSPFAA